MHIEEVKKLWGEYYQFLIKDIDSDGYVVQDKLSMFTKSVLNENNFIFKSGKAKPKKGLIDSTKFDILDFIASIKGKDYVYLDGFDFIKDKYDIVCWWSGGVTSAVACKEAIELYGKDRCMAIMIDTFNEHDDTYRFKEDCEKWYGVKIETISVLDYEALSEYRNIQDTWYRYNSLSTANGALCSNILKRRVREEWQNCSEYNHQVFGFEMELNEYKRAKNLLLNHPKTKAIFPLLMKGYNKKDCIKIIQDAGIKIPTMYELGFHNNNCFKTGCVQGGIGYWQKIQREFPEKFEEMARIEHDLTNRKGSPVTMLKSGKKEDKEVVDKTGLKWKAFVFLKSHPNYPELKSIDDMEGREPEPLMECSGFCSLNDGVNTRKQNDNVLDQLNMFDNL